MKDQIKLLKKLRDACTAMIDALQAVDDAPDNSPNEEELIGAVEQAVGKFMLIMMELDALKGAK